MGTSRAKKNKKHRGMEASFKYAFQSGPSGRNIQPSPPIERQGGVTRAGAAAGRRFAPGWLRLKVLQRDRFRCRYCGTKVTEKTANMDHVTPWPYGLTEIRNLRTACIECNRRKGGRSLDQWRRRGRRITLVRG